MSRRDRQLGMGRDITRRDFLNGVSIAVTSSLFSCRDETPLVGDAPYPPALTGLRGDHDGSWEAAHKMKDGATWGNATDTGETYDLVVVGGGISGLAAAHFFRKSVGNEARILVLDNHDDFGGHAKRNEFTSSNGRFLIGYGGSQSIDTPSGFSDESIGLFEELGIELERFHSAFDGDLYSSLGLSRGTFFDRESFGTDRLVVRRDLSWEDFAALMPLDPEAQRDLVRLHEEPKDYLAELAPAEKKEKLRAISYLEFLEKHARVHEQVLRYFQTRTNGQFGIGIDGVSALIGWRLGFPGMKGIDLPTGAVGRMGQLEPTQKRDPYIFHFPDGNASIPRLLVRSLIPAVASGNTMEDVVTARFDYTRLDDESSAVRIRLESTVVRAESDHEGVNVTYLRGGQASRVRGRYAVLACWNSLIPYLCPELPEEQKKALSYAVKVPLNYTNVQIRNWQSFAKLGISHVSCLGTYWAGVGLDFPVALGDYVHPRSPDEPMVLHLSRSYTSPGQAPKEQFQTGRYEMISTSFEDFERYIRDQLDRILSPGGFDPARDIEAITVNRWPHGYAYEYAYLGEPEWTDENKPCVLGRKPFGRMAIANSDAGGEAYADCAIDQAHRAVQELVALAD